MSASDEPIDLLDDPPGALDVIAILVGMLDGDVLISDAARVAMGRCEVQLIRDEKRGGFRIRVRPAHPQ